MLGYSSNPLEYQAYIRILYGAPDFMPVDIFIHPFKFRIFARSDFLPALWGSGLKPGFSFALRVDACVYNTIRRDSIINGIPPVRA